MEEWDGPTRPEPVAGRFVLREVLKGGPRVQTYLATDRATGASVVLKRAPAGTVGPAVAMRLEHDAGVLSRLGALGGVGAPPVLAYGTDGGWTWMARPFVLGEPLADRLARGAVGSDDALVVASAALGALVAAHGRGVLHRDIRPSNIIVSGGESVESAVLVDFGLTRAAWSGPGLPESALQSARYGACGQDALSGAPADAGSDLFSLGAVLFEALAGRPLFDGDDLGEVIRQRSRGTVPDLLRLRSDVPRALEELVARLVGAQVADRYQSAQGALADVEAIRRLRAEGSMDPAVVIGSHDVRSNLARAGFVGRAAELDVLVSAFSRAAGSGGTVLLEGESGSGKTRLAEELARRAAAQGALVLYGQGEAQSAKRPFQIFDGVAAGLASAARQDSALAGHMRRVLGDQAEAVAASSTELGEVLGFEAGWAGEQDAGGAERVVAALGRLLDACGTSTRPALVVLDDAQWSQRSVGEVLARWAGQGAPGRHTLVVAIARAEELPQGGALRLVPWSTKVSLAPFGEADVRDILSSMAGPLPEEAVSTVLDLAGGSPFMAEAVLLGLMERRALVRSEHGWKVEPEALRDVQTSRRAALFLARRLTMLARPTRALLAAAAVLGRDFDLELAVVLSGLPADLAVPAIDQARRSRILWVDEALGTGRFIHDKLRESVLDGMAHQERSDLHLQAARRIRSRGGGPFALAYHYDAAGRHGEAFEPALAAARECRGRHDLEAAELYYAIAQRGAPDDEARAVVAEGLGDVLALAGRYDAAEAQLNLAWSMAEGDSMRAALDLKQGEVAFRRGDQARAVADIEAALRRIGRRVPKGKAGRALAALWEVAVQVAHSVLPARLYRRRRAPSDAERLAMRSYSRLAYAYWFRDGTVACTWAHLRELNLAERFALSAELAQAWSEHAPAMTMVPLHRRALAYARRSLQARAELADAWGRGQSLGFYGVALYAASRYVEATAACEEAAEILARTGDRWELNTARYQLAYCRYRLGDWDEAARLAQEVHGAATAIGDQTAAGVALGLWSMATGGRAPAELLAAALERPEEDLTTTTILRLGEGLRLLRMGGDGALEVFEGAWKAVRAAGLRQEYVAQVLPWLATAQRLRADGLTPGSPERRELDARARRTARRAARLSRCYRNNLPHALRELALAQLRAGHLRGARRALNRSIRVASAQGAAWEEAMSRRERGRIGDALGWPGAAKDLQAAAGALGEIEGRAGGAGPEPGGAGEEPDGAAQLLVGRGFPGLLEAGRAVAAASHPSAVFESLRHAVVGLLRVDSCQVIDTGEAGDPIVVAGPRDPVDHDAVRRAARSGAPVVSSSAAPGNGGGHGSVLCVPIVSEGRTTAVLHAARRAAEDRFGPGEVNVAKLLAALAGAALEHTAGSAAHFRALVQHAYDITIVVGQDGLVSYASPSVVRILGYTPEEIVGREGLCFVEEEDAQRAGDALERVLSRSSAEATLEVAARDREGGARWLELAFTDLHDDPLVEGVVVNVHDVTERRRAEQARSRAAMELRLAFENAPIGMALTDIRSATAGRFLRVNAALASMLGYTTEALAGRSIVGMTHPDDLAADLDAIERLQSGQITTYETEKRYRHAAGHWIWVHLKVVAAPDDGSRGQYVISQMVDITERRAAEARLTHQALHDPLTGLPNRRLLHDRLGQALAGATRRSGSVAVLYLDLDRFKVINDSFGHDVGDRVLVEVARRLGEVRRASDTLARLGGDEFVLLVEDMAGLDEVKAISARAQEALRQPLLLGADATVSLTTSVGIALARPGRDGPALLRDADTALYRAKERGRACDEVFGEHLRHRALGRMRAERDLRAAIDEERLLLAYQPVVDLVHGVPVAAEALLRYRGRTGALVLPASFIEVAEETGLIVDLGRWALGTACAQAARWRGEPGLDHLRVSVNVSPRQLAAPDFEGIVLEALEQAGAPPDALALEITEAALLDTIDAWRPALSRLRDLGCRIGIDDFGTGYSSFSYLRRLPADFVKVDKSFVASVGADAHDTAIVGAVVGLAESLGMEAIAEGAETEAQVRILRAMGCPLAQGFWFGRPVPPDRTFDGRLRRALGQQRAPVVSKSA